MSVVGSVICASCHAFISMSVSTHKGYEERDLSADRSRIMTTYENSCECCVKVYGKKDPNPY